MHAYANPLRFQKIADAVYPWTAWGTAILAPVGLVLALAVAPADYQQGEAYRIMYVHVPAAWMAMFGYLCVAVGSAVGLIWRHPLAEVAARAAAPIGAVFTAIALITGSIWGKPMWGTWWVWDARLTSVLILFFLYLGYMALHDAFEDPARGARAASILALVGVVNLPIIKFSVDWWNTLHQPASIIRMDGPHLAPAMLWPLLTMVLVFHLYFVTVLILRMRAQLTERRIQNLRLSVPGRRLSSRSEPAADVEPVAGAEDRGVAAALGDRDHDQEGEQRDAHDAGGHGEGIADARQPGEQKGGLAPAVIPALRACQRRIADREPAPVAEAQGEAPEPPVEGRAGDVARGGHEPQGQQLEALDQQAEHQDLGRAGQHRRRGHRTGEEAEIGRKAPHAGPLFGPTTRWPGQSASRQARRRADPPRLPRDWRGTIAGTPPRDRGAPHCAASSKHPQESSVARNRS